MTYTTSAVSLSDMALEEVDYETFISWHKRELEAEPARNFSFLVQLNKIAKDPKALKEARFWSTGTDMALALLCNGTIVFGEIEQDNFQYFTQQELLGAVRRLRGPEPIIAHMAQTFGKNGIEFSKPMPQVTMELSAEPSAPVSKGHSRKAQENDIELLAEWCHKFQAEAMPDLPAVPTKHLETRCVELVNDEAIAIWEDEGEKVSTAAIVTRLPRCEAVSLVYTPPVLRSNGYAGSVVSYLSKEIINSGRLACLYVDARNPISARCYQTVGYEPVGHHVDAIRIRTK